MHKRISSIFFCILIIVLNSRAMADTIYEELSSSTWKYFKMSSESTTYENTETVIVWFHGSTSQGGSLYQLRELLKVNGPAKYYITSGNEIPIGMVIYEPHARNDQDFWNTKLMHDFVEEVQVEYPNAKLVLVGFSNGACGLYKFACEYPSYADGWGFWAGRNTTGKELYVKNALVVSGTKDTKKRVGLSRQVEFQSLFETSLDLYTRTKVKCGFVEQETNNAFYVGEWGHGEIPQMLLEDFFWDWIGRL